MSQTPADTSVHRLISFLGTGKYEETTYSFQGSTCQTQYVTHALAELFRPKEIRLIATEEAWKQHGDRLAQVLRDFKHPASERVHVPTGGEPEQLWQLFAAIVDVIRTSDGPVLLDITHGFRMQPFFAAACIEYVQSVLPNPPQIRVVYGEFRGPDKESPIWELTPFLEVLSWSRTLMMFLRTGQADDVVAPTKALGRELSRQWAMSGRQGSPPQLRELAQALQAFGNDFTTIRTGALLIGEEKKQPSAQWLWDAIERTKGEVSRHLPALALVLDQVQAMVKPLRTNGDRLSRPNGQRALIALAKLYQKMGRYSEAISILREGWITLGAPETCDMPGTTEFDNDARMRYERLWVKRYGDHPDPVAELRNDIQHAGFKRQPHDRDWFERQLQKLLDEWEKAVEDWTLSQSPMSNCARLYLLNSPIVTAYGDWRFEPISVETAQKLLREGYLSAIGHQASAQILTALLGVEVPVNRVPVYLQPDDQAIVLWLKERLPEGKVLTEEEMKTLRFELGLLTRLH